eukprot:CAMPEP_0205806598 /NCGR_PEP_ID=MMETSP0205-20121125/10217_1 /ASSEMBLY_ACC=CAM_ASM_000278 /TAXON_ID=36767 /ORGANISM="Euplotes focardii, Strain TN1" /LENGTH=155 /DNA_ID=CAMNT_0053079767 /DNA_START=168 /DNA_END=635 /DNA_ORIENTATION=-
MDSIFAPQSMTKRQSNMRHDHNYIDFEGSFGKNASKVFNKNFETPKGKILENPTIMQQNILDFNKVTSGFSNGFDTPRIMTRQMSNSALFRPEAQYMQGNIEKKNSIKNTMMKKRSSTISQKNKQPKPCADNKETRWKKENDRKLFPAFLNLVNA